jgi:hypothetical protein
MKTSSPFKKWCNFLKVGLNSYNKGLYNLLIDVYENDPVAKECELNRFRIFTTSFVLIFPFEINHLSR